MTERLSGRRRFSALQTSGDRVGRGAIRRVSVMTDDRAAAVGFAIPRRVGGAVMRNRIKRRLRAEIAELERDGMLPGGDHLIRVHAPIDEWSPGRLRRTMRELFAGAGSDRPDESSVVA